MGGVPGTEPDAKRGAPSQTTPGSINRFVVEQWSRRVERNGVVTCPLGPRRAKLAPVSFSGFPPEALAFYEGLAADNTKAYWDAHRDVYEDCIREPLELLVAELVPEFGGAKVFRPYRDVRFSKDKTPYKTAQAALFTADGGSAHRYVQLSAGGLMVGGGRYHLERDELAKVRRAIDDEVHGKELERIREELEAAGMTYMPPEVKTAPRGFAKDHPRIDLLRRRRHVAMRTFAPEPWLHTPEAKERIAEAWRRMAPLNAWLERQIG